MGKWKKFTMFSKIQEEDEAIKLKEHMGISGEQIL